jgi:hypothetical protein
MDLFHGSLKNPPMMLSILAPVPSDAFTQATPREFHQADELARRLGRNLGVAVPVIEGPLADAPAAGFVLVFELANGPLDPLLGRRLIAFERDRSTIMTQLEEQGLACGVDKFHSFAWRQGGTKEGPGVGVIGRRDIIERMPARVLESGPFTSARYAGCSSDTARDLIALLARYLSAYAEVVDVG